MIEKAVSVITVIFAFFFLVASFQIEGFSLSEIGASTWPMMLMVMMLFIGIVLVADLFGKKSRDHRISEEGKVSEDDEALIYPRNLLFLVLTFAGFTAALPYAGFLISAIILMTVITTLFGMKKWWHRILTAVLSSAVFVLVFPMLLNIPFPRGTGIFREISILFY